MTTPELVAHVRRIAITYRSIELMLGLVLVGIGIGLVVLT